MGSLADVVFVVASKDDAGGHLENVRSPAAQPLSDFTLEQVRWVGCPALLAIFQSFFLSFFLSNRALIRQLLNGDVFYVDKGLVAESQIGLRMSNKRSRTNGGVITLRIQSFWLEVVAVNNTGLTLASGSSALVTPHNLTFTTNAPGQSINIR